jgi:dihydroxy-acid dehydratase
VRDPAVIASRQSPIDTEGGLVALFGSLAPGGALLKRAAADRALFEHQGRAVVFDSLDDLAARIDDPALDVVPEDILVLRNAGPNSPAAMPEAGYLPIPRKLAVRGVKDMIRISDARMSGTAFGTVILHVTPEAAQGGPLAVVRSGDRVRLSVSQKRVDLLVDEATLASRLAALPAPGPVPRRGYDWLYHAHVLQATEGCDFDFMLPAGGPPPGPDGRNG